MVRIIITEHILWAVVDNPPKGKCLISPLDSINTLYHKDQGSGFKR